MSGSTVVVGGCKDATGMGSVYVFQGTAGIWTQQAQLSSGVANDSFGAVVAIDGNSIAIGALIPQGAAVVAGAYVFVLSGTAWTQQADFTPYTTGILYSALISISISGDTIVLGAVFVLEPGYNEVHVYVRGGSTWTHQATLFSDGYGTGAILSASVSGDTAVVVYRTSRGENGTAVYVRTQSTWAVQAVFTGGTGGPASVSGDTLVAGESVYARSAGAWTLQSILPISPSTLSLSGGNLMAGTYWFIDTAPNVTVQSDTPGRPFTVFGTGCGAAGPPFTTPFDFFWPGGTACTLSFTSPDHSVPGALFTFLGWAMVWPRTRVP